MLYHSLGVTYFPQTEGFFNSELLLGRLRVKGMGWVKASNYKL